MIAQLRTFLNRRFAAMKKDDVPINKSEWFHERRLEVYVRAGRIYNRLDHKFRIGVCVSNITVRREFRGQGHFRMFLQELEDYAQKLGYEDISFESVGSDRLVKILEKHGYTRSEMEFDPWPNYYKTLNSPAVASITNRRTVEVIHN